MIPAFLCITEIAIPNKTSPIEFKALNIKFCGYIFQEQR